MSETIRFMLLMPWGRVGSNLLLAVLRQSAPMKLDSERFNQLRTEQEQRTWFEEFYEIAAARPSFRFIGSKQNVLAIRDFGAMRDLIDVHALRLVRLRRDNIVKAAVSQMRAEQYAEQTGRETGIRQWGVKKGERTLGARELDPDILMRRIELIEKMQDRMMTAAFGSAMVLDIEYEHINAALSETVDRLRRFLDVPAKPFRIPFAKATPDDLRCAITNFAAVEARLAGTRFADLLS